jgi:transcriptional regulator with XRE-family HTH domain
MTKQGGWPPSGFGKRLRQIREQVGITQKELAERAGCHAMTIAKLERGVQEPAWPLVQVLGKALGVNCLAFTAEAPAAPLPEPLPHGKSRREKAEHGANEPKQARGRPRKEQ